MAVQNPVILEIDGAGALISNVGPHGADPRSFILFRDLIRDQARRIRKRPGIGAAVGTTLAGITSMHEYIYTNPSTGAVDYYLLRAASGAIEFRKNGGAWTAMTFPTFTTTGNSTPSAGGLWVFENVENRVFACNGKDDLIVFDGSGSAWKKAGIDGPATALTYNLTAADPPYTTGTVAITKGDKNIVGTGTTWTIGAAWVGKKIDINGVRYTISSVPGANSIVLTEGVKEDTASGLSYSIYIGVGDWNNPPRYAYAYYNPTTGHASNIRAASVTTENVLEITERNVVGRTITINNITFSPAAFADGYTKIKLFRTAKDSAILQALNITPDIDNSSGAGSTSFTETVTTFADTFLTKFEAPLTKNSKPPVALSAIKYHQGRVWGTKQNRIYASLIPEEVNLGVAEECWPARQNRVVNQSRGLLTLGGPAGSDNLVIQTALGDFSIDGFDNRDFRTYPLPTRKTGSHQFGALGDEGTLFAVYVDKRLFAYPGAEDLGLVIQDKLSAVRDSLLSGVRVQRFSSKERNLLLISAPKASGSTANDYTFVYDFDTGRWEEWNIGFAAFATAHNSTTGELELWGSSPAGVSYLLLQANEWQDAAANFTPKLITSVIRALGEKVFSDLRQIDIWVNDAAAAWAGELLLNEQAEGAGQAVTFSVSRHQSQDAQGKKLSFVPPSTFRTAGRAWQFVLPFPAGNAEYIVEKIVLTFEAKHEGAQ